MASPKGSAADLGGNRGRARPAPSSEIPLPATHAATEDFWPTTLVEGLGTPVSIGAIAGGCVGGNPGLSLWNGAEALARDLLPDVGESNRDGGGGNQVDPTGWIDGSDIAGDAERPLCGLPVAPIAALSANLANPFTSTFAIVSVDEDVHSAIIESTADAPGKYPCPAKLDLVPAT